MRKNTTKKEGNCVCENIQAMVLFIEQVCQAMIKLLFLIHFI